MFETLEEVNEYACALFVVSWKLTFPEQADKASVSPPSYPPLPLCQPSAALMQGQTQSLTVLQFLVDDYD